MSICGVESYEFKSYYPPGFFEKSKKGYNFLKKRKCAVEFLKKKNFFFLILINTFFSKDFINIIYTKNIFFIKNIKNFQKYKLKIKFF